MPVANYCHQDVVTARPDETARDVATRMRQRDVGCVVIVDEQRKPIGVVTDRDLVQQVLRRRRDPDATAISEVMNDEVVTVGEQMPLGRALARMRQEAVRRIVVVEATGVLCGILTQDDILPIVSREIELAAGVIQQQLAADPAPATT